MITLFGATGYTGQRVAWALAQRDQPFRLAGRSPNKLERLAASLPQPPVWLVADATQPNTLSPLFEDTTVLVNCAGPFTDLGEPVLAQAALSGVHYLDTTNELGYVYRMQGYDPLAQRSRCALVPSCGFEVALADCAAAVLAKLLAASEGQALDQIDVFYDIHGRGSSLGSRRSAVRALATSWLGYRQGQWQPTTPCREGGRVQLPHGPRPILSFPSSEIVTVPHHLAVHQVKTWTTVSWHALSWAPLVLPVFAWLVRGPVGRLVEVAVTRISPPPQRGLRSADPFVIRIEAHRADEQQALILTGKGVYDLTAEIVAYAANQMAQPSYGKAGVLPPARALDPQALLDEAVAHWTVDLQYD
ncbi:MAG: saccharopine dehydrogenase NADP-binding domain-containing protein [Anaerolineae bacterium]